MSITVHGTFEPNKAVFCDLPECVEYCAEPIFSGEHAGQIALTITGADDEDCNDTFYGCINPATGKFQVVIPEDCCVEPGESEEYCKCWDSEYPSWSYGIEYNLGGIVRHEDKCWWSKQDDNINNIPAPSLWWKEVICGVPIYYTLIFSGVNLCPTRSWPGGISLNNLWILTQRSYDEEWCTWEYVDSHWHMQLLMKSSVQTILGARDTYTYKTYFLTATGIVCKKGGKEFNEITCDSDHYGYEGQVIYYPGL